MMILFALTFQIFVLPLERELKYLEYLIPLKCLNIGTKLFMSAEIVEFVKIQLSKLLWHICNVHTICLC